MERVIHVQGYFHDGSKDNNLIVVKRKVKESRELETYGERERERERHRKKTERERERLFA
jgi:hypothetical protein